MGKYPLAYSNEKGMYEWRNYKAVKLVVRWCL